MMRAWRGGVDGSLPWANRIAEFSANRNVDFGAKSGDFRASLPSESFLRQNSCYDCVNHPGKIFRANNFHRHCKILLVCLGSQTLSELMYSHVANAEKIKVAYGTRYA